MGEIVLNEQSLQLMAEFEQLTGAGSRDCIIDDRNERLIFVINPARWVVQSANRVPASRRHPRN